MCTRTGRRGESVGEFTYRGERRSRLVVLSHHLRDVRRQSRIGEKLAAALQRPARREYHRFFLGHVSFQFGAEGKEEVAQFNEMRVTCAVASCDVNDELRESGQLPLQVSVVHQLDVIRQFRKARQCPVTLIRPVRHLGVERLDQPENRRRVEIFLSARDAERLLPATAVIQPKRLKKTRPDRPAGNHLSDRC